MGCDIHLFVEIRTKAGAPWHVVTPKDVALKLRAVYGDNETASEAIEVVRGLTGDDDDTRFYENRNYDLFARLADVRNHDRGIKPIAKPRGVPKDASKEYAKFVKDWDSDGHSHSFFLVKELLRHDWGDGNSDPYWNFATALKRIAALGPPEHVRVCFFFDN